MKIGFDAKRVFSNATGLGNYSRTILSNLRKYYPNEEYFLYAPFISQDQLKQFGSYFHLRQSGNAPNAIWRSLLIANQIKNDHIDIYHGLSNELPFNLKRSKAHGIITVHDVIFLKHPTFYAWPDRSIYHQKLKYSLKQADVVICISQNTKTDLLNHYHMDEAKVKVLYQSCQAAFYEEKRPTPTSDFDSLDLPSAYLLAVGTLEKRKNLETLFRAYAMICHRHSIPLVVVGRQSPYKPSLMALATKLKVERHIIWKQDIESVNDLRAIYNEATAFIYPSIYEGFGLPLVEAMLCGIPVIASNNSSLTEAAGPGSLYFSTYNAEELAGCITRTLDDSVLARQMSKFGRQYALKHFGPKKLTDQLVEIYAQLA